MEDNKLSNEKKQIEKIIEMIKEYDRNTAE